MTEAEQRDTVDRIAREWISTPYHDHGEIKGAGCDCATLLKCVFVEAGVIPPFEIGYYAPQFFLNQSEERYLGWVSKFGREITLDQVRPGDIALYWIGKCYAHGAVVIKPGWPNIIHAHYGSRCVLRGKGTAVHLGTPIKGVKYFTLW